RRYLGATGPGGVRVARDLIGRPFCGPFPCAGFGRYRRLHVEDVADALEGLDRARLARRGAELAAYAADPHAQVLKVVAVLRAPDLAQELRVEHDLARVGGEMLEQQPLGPAQRDQLATLGDQASLQ